MNVRITQSLHDRGKRIKPRKVVQVAVMIPRYNNQGSYLSKAAEIVRAKLDKLGADLCFGVSNVERSKNLFVKSISVICVLLITVSVPLLTKKSVLF